MSGRIFDDIPSGSWKDLNDEPAKFIEIIINNEVQRPDRWTDVHLQDRSTQERIRMIVHFVID